MKKGIYLIGLMLILLTSFVSMISFISASYDCNGTLDEDMGEVDLYGRKGINGIGIGLTWSDENAVNGRYSANLFVDAMDVSLSSGVLSEDIELKKGIYNISISNFTGGKLNVGVSGSSAEIEEKDTGTIGGLKVYLASVSGVYPDSILANLVVGDISSNLNNYDNLEDLVTIDGIEYVLSLFSASDNNALVNVNKCDGGVFVEVADVVVNDSIVNDSLGNVTDINVTNVNVSDGNENVSNVDLNQSESNLNQSDSQTEINQSAQTGDSEKSIFEKLNLGLIFLLVVVILIVVVLFFYFKFVIQKEKEFKELSESYNSSESK